MTRKIPYVTPFYQGQRYNCPHCHAFSNMVWFNPTDRTARTAPQPSMKDTEVSKCSSCLLFSHWVDHEMVYPMLEISVDDPNEDLPPDIKKDYLEAAYIIGHSPRGAAALLRLAIQKLCDELIKDKGDLNFKIGKLVENGLNKKVQQALDVVRVVGNNAIHPGQIDLKDKPETANQLFILVNMVAQQMITEVAEVDAMFESLPDAAKKGIKQRDAK